MPMSEPIRCEGRCILADFPNDEMRPCPDCDGIGHRRALGCRADPSGVIDNRILGVLPGVGLWLTASEDIPRGHPVCAWPKWGRVRRLDPDDCQNVPWPGVAVSGGLAGEIIPVQF